jgi:hypothetical protein
MPEEYIEYGDQWAMDNRDWSVVNWDIDELIRDGDWLNSEVLTDLVRRDQGRGGIEFYVQAADVLDYELLWKYGGIYLNCDISPARTLEDLDLIHGTLGSAWVAREDETFVVNAAMGAPGPEHPFFGEVINQLGPRYFSNPYQEMNHATGPRLLTDVWSTWKDQLPPVIALPVVAFNPFHWRTIPKGGDAVGRPVPLETIGVHHWGHKKDGRTNHIESWT